MQSVHACAVQTHFSVFVVFLKKGSLKSLNLVNFGVIFCKKNDVCVEKEGPKTGSKKGAPPDSNAGLFPCPEAPGAAASRAHCSDKKQLFEQQLKHCSRFLQKKVNWAQNRCKKLTGLLNRSKKTAWIAENC